MPRPCGRPGWRPRALHVPAPGRPGCPQGRSRLAPEDADLVAVRGLRADCAYPVSEGHARRAGLPDELLLAVASDAGEHPLGTAWPVGVTGEDEAARAGVVGQVRIAGISAHVAAEAAAGDLRHAEAHRVR